MNKKMRMKPSKGQSILGMAVGIVFCFIGLCIVIPSLGFFGIVWTGVAVGITVMNAINVFSEEGIATHEIIVEDIEKKTANQPKKASMEERLSMVDQLYRQGSITMEEREEKRKKILDEI